MMSAVLKFPEPILEEQEDDEFGGGDSEDGTFRLMCPTENCGSRHFHIQWSVDRDNSRVYGVYAECSNCGEDIRIPD